MSGWCGFRFHQPSWQTHARWRTVQCMYVFSASPQYYRLLFPLCRWQNPVSESLGNGLKVTHSRISTETCVCLALTIRSFKDNCVFNLVPVQSLQCCHSIKHNWINTALDTDTKTWVGKFVSYSKDELVPGTHTTLADWLSFAIKLRYALWRHSSDKHKQDWLFSF